MVEYEIKKTSSRTRQSAATWFQALFTINYINHEIIQETVEQYQKKPYASDISKVIEEINQRPRAVFSNTRKERMD